MFRPCFNLARSRLPRCAQSSMYWQRAYRYECVQMYLQTGYEFQFASRALRRRFAPQSSQKKFHGFARSGTDFVRSGICQQNECPCNHFPPYLAEFLGLALLAEQDTLPYVPLLRHALQRTKNGFDNTALLPFTRQYFLQGTIDASREPLFTTPKNDNSRVPSFPGAIRARWAKRCVALIPGSRPGIGMRCHLVCRSECVHSLVQKYPSMRNSNKLPAELCII